MKQKITPEYVLTMLQELKKSLDEKKFNLPLFVNKYPSYSAFRKHLRSKGIIKKQYGEYKWISIEPNIIMAKELIKLYLLYSREIQEKLNNSKKDFNKIESDKKIKVLEELENKINSTKPITKKSITKSKSQFESPFMSFVKEIRQEGEKWNDAVKRASIMKGGKIKTIKTRPQTMEELYPNSFIEDLRKEIGNKKEHIEALQEEREFLHESYTEKIESTERKYKQLQEELVRLRKSLSREEKEGQQYRKFFLNNGYLPKEVEDLKQSLNLTEKALTNQEVANEGLKQRLREAEKGIDDNVKMLLQKNSELKETIEIREKEIENLVNRYEHFDKPLPEPTYDFPPDFLEPEVSKPQEKFDISKGSRTYKLFGIPVFSISNK